MVQCSTAGGDCNIVLNEETDTISCTTHSNTDLVEKLYASSIENTFNTNIPGYYLAIWDYTDSSGNISSTLKRWVIVSDTTAPDIEG